jgi:two-component system, LytTR family, sensor kinase
LKNKGRFQPVIMNPAVFISASVLLGCFFALQDWMSMRLWSSHRIEMLVLLEGYGAFYLLWGILCWLLWRWMGERIEQEPMSRIVLRLIPLSIVFCLAQMMIFAALFPNLPMNRPHMDYWHRLEIELSDEPFSNVVIFWCAFGLFRGIGYYRRYREKEDAAAQLEVQLANAQISALRMQLNPHFLFNTMNGISSLMRMDVAAADTMLEQLGSLLRITLSRGDAQLIPLRDEMEFVELYLAMQDQRFGSRVRQSIKVDSELHDALVPAMILQPIVENAYAHGLSKLDHGGVLRIEAHREGGWLELSVLNNGPELNGHSGRNEGSSGGGVGLSNVKARLRLHYGDEHTFSMRPMSGNVVRVAMTFPLHMAERCEEKTARYGE